MAEALLEKPIPAEILATDLELRQRVEAALVRKYPGIDVAYDPAHDLLEGKYRAEMEDCINRLVNLR